MTPTPPRAAVPAQPDALQIESAYEGEALIGYRITGSGNPDSRALVWIDQKAMPGIRDGNEFVPGYGKRIDYRPLSLHAQVAALTAQGAAERAAPAATVIKRGANREFMSERLGHLPDGIYSLYLAATPAHVQPPAQTEHVDADVSKNGQESNMTGGAWTERWHGSGGKSGYEGWSIVNKDDRDLVAYLGRNVESEAVTEIVMAHNNALRASHAQAPAGAAVPLMTAEEVNALPAEARAYIHQLEANTDPAGMVRENMQLCDTNAGLQAMYRKAADALKEVIGCFGAASDEGLAEALAETTDERLKDLLERRLMYALYAAQEAVAEPTTAQAAPAAGAVAAPPQPAQCTVPPLGWRCTRAAGHEGPCAAVEDVGP